MYSEIWKQTLDIIVDKFDEIKNSSISNIVTFSMPWVKLDVFIHSETIYYSRRSNWVRRPITPITNGWQSTKDIGKYFIDNQTVLALKEINQSGIYKDSKGRYIKLTNRDEWYDRDRSINNGHDGGIVGTIQWNIVTFTGWHPQYRTVESYRINSNFSETIENEKKRITNETEQLKRLKEEIKYREKVLKGS